MSERALIIRLSEPELWAVVRNFELAPTPVSPLWELRENASTLDEILAAGRDSLVRRKLADANRTNWILGAAVKVLCEPQEQLSFMERGNIGTRLRRFFGRKELFVEHTCSLSNEHGIAFPWTRGTIVGMAARSLGMEVRP